MKMTNSRFHLLPEGWAVAPIPLRDTLSMQASASLLGYQVGYATRKDWDLAVAKQDEKRLRKSLEQIEVVELDPAEFERYLRQSRPNPLRDEPGPDTRGLEVEYIEKAEYEKVARLAQNDPEADAGKVASAKRQAEKGMDAGPRPAPTPGKSRRKRFDPTPTP